MKKIAMLITLFIMFPFIVFCSELQKAIDNAKEGAVILLDDGVYDGPVVINKALTIRGTGKKAYISVINMAIFFIIYLPFYFL